MDVGWLRELDTADFNENFNILRREFRRDAYENNSMEKAKGQATELMELIMTPLVASIGNGYEIEVNYRGSQGVLN